MDLKKLEKLPQCVIEAIVKAKAEFLAEEAAKSGTKHQTPPWVRRCVASVGSKSDSTDASQEGQRAGLSKAFAICQSQYRQKMDKPKTHDKQAVGKKGWKDRMKQYDALLKGARKKKS